MTENEAIERLKCMRLFMQINDKASESKFLEEDYIANTLAVKALKEIQQYRAIGTVEHLIDMKQNYAEALSDWRQYRKIGTVEECREAMERQEPRLLNDREIAFIGKGTEIQSRCPQCGIILGIGISEKPIIPKEIRHCFNCGQKLYR